MPLAVKIGPFFSAPAAFARRLAEAGADALVLFNRFYQPDFDLNTLEVRPNLRLSTPDELLLRLHWVAILYGRSSADLAVTGGVHSGRDVLKAMMAGARVAMTTSALLQHGVGRLRTMLAELTDLDGGERVRVDPADAGKHEHAFGRRPGGVRAGQLHEGAAILLAARPARETASRPLLRMERKEIAMTQAVADTAEIDLPKPVSESRTCRPRRT